MSVCDRVNCTCILSYLIVLFIKDFYDDEITFLLSVKWDKLLILYIYWFFTGNDFFSLIDTLKIDPILILDGFIHFVTIRRSVCLWLICDVVIFILHGYMLTLWVPCKTIHKKICVFVIDLWCCDIHFTRVYANPLSAL